MLTEADSPGAPRRRPTAACCWRSLATVLDPPPLLTGDDLLAHGIPSGPQYKTLLQRCVPPSWTVRFTTRPRRW